MIDAAFTELESLTSVTRACESNDNPYSGSAFKTLKYCPVFPKVHEDKAVRLTSYPGTVAS